MGLILTEDGKAIWQSPARPTTAERSRIKTDVTTRFNPVRAGENTQTPTDHIIAVAAPRPLCERCAKHNRLGHSTMCAGCIRITTRADLIYRLPLENFLNRQFGAKEFLLVSAICGAIVIFLSYFSPGAH